MTPREKLDNLCMRFSNKLTEYIEFSDQIIKKSGSFRSLFFRVPFEEFAIDSSKIAKEWSLAVVGLDIEIRNQFYRELQPQEQQVYDALVDWVRAVSNATKILSENQDRFYKASQSYKNSDLTLEETKERSKKYNIAQDQYYELGNRLQDLWKKLH